jgi:hypothetical protein
MELVLRSGRKIALARLDQSRTYEGLLAGEPHREDNDKIVERLVDKAHRLEAIGEPHLIVPVRTAFQARRPSHRVLRAIGARPRLVTDPGQFRDYERLPAIASMGVFDSGPLHRAGSEPFSSLTLAWFQDAFGPPVADPVRSQIEALDWERLAKDWCW